MASEIIRASRLNHTLRAALMIGVTAGVATVGACSQVPDAVNPAQWYRKTVDVFAGDEKKEPKRQSTKESDLKADRGQPPPGADQPFPNLASVDEKARRDNLSGGLSADPERPKYAPAIERQGQAANVLQPKPPAVAAAPAPPAAPTTPVTAAPIPPPAPAPLVQAPTPAPMARAPAAQPPATMTEDQHEQEARLTRQLAEIQARALESGPLPANAMRPSTLGEFATVVVSSQGIETTGQQAAVVAEQPMMAAPTGAGPGAAGAPPVPGSSIKVATILFENGSSLLKANDKQILDAVSRLYKERGGNVHVVGHASSRTRNLSAISHKMANFKISVDRADAVAKELMRLGVRQENIQIAAVADTEPMYFEIMPSGEAGNRRTEIYLGR